MRFRLAFWLPGPVGRPAGAEMSGELMREITNIATPAKIPRAKRRGGITEEASKLSGNSRPPPLGEY
eukprot:1237349-Amorphochlora_amoeboformis.AAC.1